MPPDNRNPIPETSRTNYYNPQQQQQQQQRESETGISVDRQYDTGYNGTHEGDYKS